MGHLFKLGILFQTLEKPVVGDATAHVMNVMHADVAREPMKESRQVVEGAAPKSGGVETPRAVFLPIRILELVLYVEEPYTSGGCNHGDRELNLEKLLEPHGSPHNDDHGQDYEIRHQDTGPPSPTGPPKIRWKSVPYDEEVDRAYAEEKEGMAVESVAHPLPKRKPEILFDRQGRNVSDIPLVKVPGSGVMDGMRSSPVAVGGEGQDSQHEAEHVVGSSGPEKRA